LGFQVLDVQFGNFLRRRFDHIVTVQEDWHLLPPPLIRQGSPLFDHLVGEG
jgi:hypothetical protein